MFFSLCAKNNHYLSWTYSRGHLCATMRTNKSTAMTFRRTPGRETKTSTNSPCRKEMFSYGNLICASVYFRPETLPLCWQSDSIPAEVSYPESQKKKRQPTEAGQETTSAGETQLFWLGDTSVGAPFPFQGRSAHLIVPSISSSLICAQLHLIQGVSHKSTE